MFFVTFLKHVPSSEEDGSRQAKDLILRKMFINEEDREIYPNEKIGLQKADLSGGGTLVGGRLVGGKLAGGKLRGRWASFEEANLGGAHLEAAAWGQTWRRGKLGGANLLAAPCWGQTCCRLVGGKLTLCDHT